ncbi:uncharacterized protein LOC113386225 [Ctenocephalides felis]|uniref:uncharacterized protein LOC113386225 n=1 Tax=Ctenocephalides felis TaxID=7515 RepID=UPI000E6E2F26|nr:uncharacterized protein LOC113386225 [Ctenocephalides felis]
MALFKAYSDDKTEKEGSVDQQNIELITESEFPQKVDTHGNKHGSDASDNDLFFIDSMGNQNNLLDNSNARKIERKEDYVQIRKTKKKTKRYLKRKTLDSKPNIFNLNDELKSLQSLLSHDENNIGLWKEFINAQAKNISVGNVKAITERQISIIEEALKKNPRNAELYDLWFQCNRKIYSHNDFTKIIMEQTEKDSGNFQLWLALIDCTQQSISECNVTVVLELYQKAMTCFKKFRHQHTCNKGVLFKLFQRVTVFLRQTGSWKELLYFLEYTMWLNCSDCELSQIFKFPEISNSILIELEEAVLQSGLPLSEIWYRIESLRETFNWSTVKTDFSNLACNLTIEEMDDLTTVFSEDTTKFHLFLHILSVLRIPILPKNYSFYGVIGLTEITWHIDSCEHILYSFYETNEKHSDIMQILYDMLSTIIDGPQYWGPRPFTSDYYDFATTLIKNLMHYSKDEYDKLAFGLLYIRFIMMHINLMKYSKKTINAKSIKKKVKTLLSENNNLKSSIILYVEYAKLEACISDVSSGLNTMMALMNSGNYEVAELSYLIRTCIDYNLISDSKNLDKQLYLKMLAKLVHKEPFNNFDIPIIVTKFMKHLVDFKKL